MSTHAQVPKKAPMTSAERTREFRRRKKAEKEYKAEVERKLTRDRVRDIRRRQKMKGGEREECTRTCKDPLCTLHPERDRKRKYRERKNGKLDGRTLDGQRKRRQAIRESGQAIEKLQVSVRSLTNENRRLRRREIEARAERRRLREETEGDESVDVDGDENMDVDGEQSIVDRDQSMGVDEVEAGGSQVGVGVDVGVGGDSDEDINAPLMSSSLLDVMSPKTKKKVFRRLSQEPNFTEVKRQMRKEGHRINLRESQKELNQESEVRMSLKTKVEAFLNEDSNSIPCPDKKKVGVRYRLDFLCTLHEKFVSEHAHVECSYSQFTRLVPPHIKKPKPTDWGTCLCMTCLNPQLMLEGLKRSVPGAFNGLTIEDDLLKYSIKELDELKRKIVGAESDSKKKKNIAYLHWEKVKTTKEREEEEKDGEKRTGEEKKEKKKSVTYVSEKRAVVDPPSIFAKKFVASLVELKEHTDRRISQYRRIKFVRCYVDDESNDAAALRIDWSENATLFQTRQEKGDYYKDIQISVNTIVTYEPNGVVSSHASLSDFTSHRAPATWASLKDIIPNKYSSSPPIRHLSVGICPMKVKLKSKKKGLGVPKDMRFLVSFNHCHR